MCAAWGGWWRRPSTCSSRVRVRGCTRVRVCGRQVVASAFDMLIISRWNISVPPRPRLSAARIASVQPARARMRAGAACGARLWAGRRLKRPADGGGEKATSPAAGGAGPLDALGAQLPARFGHIIHVVVSDGRGAPDPRCAISAAACRRRPGERPRAWPGCLAGPPRQGRLGAACLCLRRTGPLSPQVCGPAAGEVG